MNSDRVNIIQKGRNASGPVIYWMSRDQRASDNWALIYAQQIALERKAPLAVVFCLAPNFLEATIRQYGFMLKGLEEVEGALSRLSIPFFLLLGDPEKEIVKFVKQNKAGALIADFNPLRISRLWKSLVSDQIDILFDVVDAHNIIPCWTASSKQEFGAYTLRPKIKKLLPEFLEEFPDLKKHPYRFEKPVLKTDWAKAKKSLQINRDISEISWIRPGEKAAQSALNTFIKNKIKNYDEGRNDPSQNGQSDLSPYFHFGHIAPQRAALEIKKTAGRTKSGEAFLEEMIVRRELSDNYCYYNQQYDSFGGFPDWAKKTLNDHRKDKREYVYSLEQFEKAQTHDEIWNAAQREMMRTGKMHGYMRMYWAKKILEWTPSPEKALSIAIYLNDKYELDGRDPNGYTGIAWSIGGVHDRAWGERPVFGKIRYMAASGLERKFDIEKYVQQNLEAL